MNNKHFIWIAAAAVVITGLSLYGISKSAGKTETKGNNNPTGNLRNQQEVPQNSQRQEDSVCGKFIEEEMQRYMKNYDKYSPTAKRNFVAFFFTFSLLISTKKSIEKNNDHNNANPVRTLEKMCIEQIMDAGKKGLTEEEADALKTYRHQNDECKIYDILFYVMNSETCKIRTMHEVGVDVVLNYTEKNGPTRIKEEMVVRFNILNIKETMIDKDEKTSLKDYLAEIRLPNPTPSENKQWDDNPIKKIKQLQNVLIFYSDSTEASSMYMPESVELKKDANSDKLYTYELRSVIVKDGDKNDIYNMKLYPRPNNNIKEFERVANQKGCFFMYEIK
ncbi:hypothetical protein ENBRE01_2651 [Enteropsectra breve]|nr:hypothetical protein ENBRE01_2651 [Enteropsectra breve]